jgi:hypothetical protein
MAKVETAVWPIWRPVSVEVSAEQTEHGIARLAHAAFEFGHARNITVA